MDTYGDGNVYRGVELKESSTKTYQYTAGPTERFLPEESGDFLIHRTRVTIVPKGEPLYSVRATEIEICDEVGGEYIKVRQQTDDTEDGTICIDDKDWPVLRQVIDAMVARCRTETQEGE